MAYSATFNFNPSRGQHEQDVYFVRVSPTGGPTPTPTATATLLLRLQRLLRLHATATALTPHSSHTQPLRRALLLPLRQGRRPRRDPGRRPDRVHTRCRGPDGYWSVKSDR